MSDTNDLRAAYEKRLPLLQAVAENLQQDLSEDFTCLAHIDRISFRAKSVESFVEKVIERRVDPPYVAPLAEVEDQVAGRVLVLFESDVSTAQERVAETFTAVELEQKRPTRYNEFDYESFHGIYALTTQYLPEAWNGMEEMPKTFELQIRTLFQHAYAEPQHDLGYKPEGPLHDDTKRELAWIAASSWGADQALERVRGLSS